MKSEVFNTDCLEAMRQMPDKAFDLAIVDPPYGIDIMHAGGYPDAFPFIKWERKAWDAHTPDLEYFQELRRVSVNQIIWGGNYFPLPPTQQVVIWDKISRDFSNSDFEMAWTSFAGKNRAFTYSRAQAYTRQNKIHPTQKPVALYMWLLQHYAKPGNTILDTHLGSGSSRIAAYDLGFDFTGYELDTDYYLAQEKRFAEHLAQPKLFEAPVVTQTQEALFA